MCWEELGVWVPREVVLEKVEYIQTVVRPVICHRLSTGTFDTAEM